MSSLHSRYTASAQLTGANGGGILAFGAQPSVSVAAVLAPFFKGEQGAQGEQGIQGRDGAVGGLLKRIQFNSSTYGEQAVPLNSPTIGGAQMLVFINGLLHFDTTDQSLNGSLLTLGGGMGIYPDDNITIVYQ